MISIINYGLGNIGAFANVYKRLSIPVQIVNTPDQLERAERIILPGVGAFDHAMDKLNRSGLRERLNQKVTVDKVPVIGICVGMQMLAHRSDEGKLPGLGWVDAEVLRFDEAKLSGQQTRVPHMGWNDVNPIRSHPILTNLEHDARFYFLHSYYFKCNDPSDGLTRTDYGGEFVSAVQADNVFGVQFHPEKSLHYGIQLLKNFATL